MKFVDARRLMGPNYLGPRPLVLTELEWEPHEAAEAVELRFATMLEQVTSALGIPAVAEITTRTHRGGIVLAFEAPIDTMLAYAELAEIAALRLCDAPSPSNSASTDPRTNLHERKAELLALYQSSLCPALLALEEAAAEHEVAFLWDDESITVGLGSHGMTYARDAIPTPASVPWKRVGAIPVALVTGTNGKTTTTRLLAHIARLNFGRVGVCSTDGVELGREHVEVGDWTGPSAARRALRDEGVDCAILETARGGILRRGLTFRDYRVGIVTNVSDDHLGSYGIDDVNAMVRVKGAIAEYVAADGIAVLNACDSKLVDFADGLTAPVVYFADLEGCREKKRARLTAYLSDYRNGGGSAVVADRGVIKLWDAAGETILIDLSRVPITFGGTARYNVENVLAAVAGARGLGIPLEAIKLGLVSFTSRDNPGRGELFEVSGAWVLIDFGHNADGAKAVLALAQSLATRAGSGSLRAVIAGSPGDRSVQQLEELATAVAAAKPGLVYLRELQDYLRGRALGETPAILARGLERGGVVDNAVQLVATEVAALGQAITSAQRGDIIVLLAHVDREAVQAWLASVKAIRHNDVQPDRATPIG